MKTVKLSHFLDFLNNQSAADLKGKNVDRYLKEHKIEEGQFAPFIFFREDTYGRNLVHKTDLYELLVLTWLPRHRTPIHDHNGQRCWMLVDSGTLTFRNYATPAREVGELTPQGPLETHSAGEAVYIDDGKGIHSIANASTKPAVSVHLYAGPVPKCRIYDETKKRMEWVELCYFTQFDGDWESLGAELR